MAEISTNGANLPKPEDAPKSTLALPKANTETGVVPSARNPVDISTLSPEQRELLKTVQAQLEELVNKKNPISESTFLKAISSSILGHPDGTWQEIGASVAKTNAEVLDEKYGVPKATSPEERNKIIASGIAADLKDQVAKLPDNTQAVQNIRNSLLEDYNLPATATKEEITEAGEEKAADIVSESSKKL